MCCQEDEKNKGHLVLQLTINNNVLIDYLLKQTTLEKEANLYSHLQSLFQKKIAERKEQQEQITALIEQCKAKDSLISYDALKNIATKLQEREDARITESIVVMMKESITNELNQVGTKKSEEILEEGKFSELCKKYPLT